MRSPRPSSLRRALLLAAVVAATTAACGTTTVNDYGADAKRNFVDGCTTSRVVADGKVATTTIASRSDCECVYEKIRSTYRLSWDDLMAYEQKVADAKEGEAPEPPEKLTKAVGDCLGTTAGPAVPESSETTTTTEG